VKSKGLPGWETQQIPLTLDQRHLTLTSWKYRSLLSRNPNFRIASYNDTPAEQLVKQAALRLVEEEAKFRASVKRGLEQADRGELLDHEDVKAQIQRLLHSE